NRSYRGPAALTITTLAWAGLRGAAAIVFALVGMVSRAETRYDLFHIVFAVSFVSVLVQGSLLPMVSRRLGLVDDEGSVLRTFNDYVDESSMQLVQLKLPPEHPWVGLPLKQVDLPAN